MVSVGQLTPMNFNALQAGLQMAQGLNELQKQNLQNGALQHTLPGQIAAENAHNQGITNTSVPLSNASLGAAQARVPLMNAQTGQVLENTKLSPLTAAIQAQNSANMQDRMAQSGSRFGQSYQLNKALASMSPPARMAWIAQNQGEYNKMLAGLSQGQSSPAAQMSTLLTPELYKRTLGYAPQLTSVQQQPAPQQQSPLMGGIPLRSGMSLSQPTPQGLSQQPISENPSLGGLSPQDEIISRANQMAANQKLTTTQQQNRYQAGVALEKFLNDPEMNAQLSKMGTYAGISGAIQKVGDMATGNPRYTQYKSSVSQMGPILSGGISQLEGFAKTDKGLNEGLNYFKRAQDVLGNNPEQAQQYIDTGKKILSAELSSIKSSSQPLFSTNRSLGSSDVAKSAPKLKSSVVLKSSGASDPMGLR